ncbi:MAG: YkgJ family cysteine cluster protein [Helicobacter sp.]|nr:YkgJ family cysteine cluster protein [Helicobacter sp.]
MNIVRVPSFAFGFDSTQCDGCGGKCCTGESGYVFVSIDEMLEIAEFLNLVFEEFTKKYVRKVGSKFSLLEIPEESQSLRDNSLACVFFENGKCKIYPKRPKQCREFPFWDAHKSLDSQILSSLMSSCPGIILENATKDNKC